MSSLPSGRQPPPCITQRTFAPHAAPTREVISGVLRVSHHMRSGSDFPTKTQAREGKGKFLPPPHCPSLPAWTPGAGSFLLAETGPDRTERQKTDQRQRTVSILRSQGQFFLPSHLRGKRETRTKIDEEIQAVNDWLPPPNSDLILSFAKKSHVVIFKSQDLNI